jgi:outer membrane protein OmpA-like peptidoglycan-associated protein
MNHKINLKEASQNLRTSYHQGKKLIVAILMLLLLQSALQAQTYTRPSWWFGAAGAANFNFYRGSTQQLNADITVPTPFHNGNGVGLFLAPLIEFHKPGKRLGFLLEGGVDSRRAKYATVTNPCNCPADLKTGLSYITLEPSIRLAPFKGNFYLYAGPRFAFNQKKTFTYMVGRNPEYPSQAANEAISGDFDRMHQSLVSAQIGAGYDILLSSQNRHTQFALSPFISFQPYFGQDPRTIESWNITTLRAGVALKFGVGHKIATEDKAVVAPVKKAKDPEVKFSVNVPKVIPVERVVKETFPLRNYVFFNTGSTDIPTRYVLLNKSQVSDFKEDQLEVYTPENMSGRSGRQMNVYYNVINILGDRMGKTPSSSISLVGSSEKGPQDGKEMAESIKKYLVDIFGISASRIITEGRTKPVLPSEQPGGTKELELLREGDQRVSIVSSSPELLMEFQSGPYAPLKPIELIALQESVDSTITFNVAGAKEAFTSWSLEFKDMNGSIQNFGPYTADKVSIPGKTILGDKKEGDYTVTMVGLTKNGKTIRKETPAHIESWTSPKIEEGIRFSVLFEFNDSRALTVYEKYLTDIVTPKIPDGGTVIIHGHTDNIGDEAHNKELSTARANEVKNIIEKALVKAGRTDVKFEVNGFGEDEAEAPFENKLPEERFYNRTVVIDIITKQ